MYARVFWMNKARGVSKGIMKENQEDERNENG